MIGATEVRPLALWPGADPGPAWRVESECVRATVTAHGAHLVDVEMWSDDAWVPVSVGYSAGPESAGFHGATVGRYANRIAGATYEFDGRCHVLNANEPPNQLHGGADGFFSRDWQRIEGPDGQLALTLHSPDGDQGFPGSVDVVARFDVRENTLAITYEALASEPTALNITSHAYWNLAGGGSLDDHTITVAASQVVEVDGAGIPNPGLPTAVAETRYDCRSGRELSAIVSEGGFDHCFVIDAELDGATALELRHTTGRRLRVTTNQPGVQLYTGRHLAASHRGIAVETQRLPDAPNRPEFGLAVTTTFHSTTEVTFDHVN